MSRIYELTEQQEELLNQLYWLDENEESDQIEIDRIKKELTKIRGSAENTLEFLSGLLLNFNYDSSVHEDEQKRLVALADKAKKRKESSLKNAARIEGIMLYVSKKFDIPHIKTKYGDFSPSITPGAVIYSDGFDVEKLPAEFTKIIPEHKEPVAKEIMAYLRAKIFDVKLKKLNPNVTIVDDDSLPGVSLVRKEGIKVK